MTRTEAREKIVIILYEAFIRDDSNIKYNINELLNDNLNKDNEFIKTMVTCILDKKEELFTIANNNLKDWSILRLGIPDQAILALGIYEILYTNTPKAVVINEAVELAKKYSDDKVKNMINGVLDKISTVKKQDN